MGVKRKPFQGVVNIIRFNWHFYLLAILILMALKLDANTLPDSFLWVTNLLSSLIIITLLSSILVSTWIYDFTGVYQLKWIEPLKTEKLVITISAGFDEVTPQLKSIYPQAELISYDFYDPKKHTEVSIKRARKAYPPKAYIKKINTTDIPLTNDSVNVIHLFFAAHEIRDTKERVLFFKELNRVLSKNGKVYITEHLRDIPNFIAYTFGFFHFYSNSSWIRTFKESNFIISQTLKNNLFVKTYILEKNGDTL